MEVTVQDKPPKTALESGGPGGKGTLEVQKPPAHRMPGHWVGVQGAFWMQKWRQ